MTKKPIAVSVGGYGGHTQALLRLARHHISVLFAMLRDGTFYEPRTPRLA
ncbi:hypothetical protein ACWD6R_38490 [Streptomyces sp. NPDC005151]